MSNRVENLSSTHNLVDDFDSASKVVEAQCNHKTRKYPSPISFRPTEKEREQLILDAGGMSQSSYIRECLFWRRVSKRVVPHVDQVLLAQILATLGESRIANNLNQIAHQANSGSLILDVVTCLLYTSPSPRDLSTSRMPSSA